MAVSYNIVAGGVGITLAVMAAAGVALAVFNGGRTWQIVLGIGVCADAAITGVVFYHLLNKPADKKRAETFFKSVANKKIWMLVQDKGKKRILVKNSLGQLVTCKRGKTDLPKDYTRVVFIDVPFVQNLPFFHSHAPGLVNS